MMDKAETLIDRLKGLGEFYGHELVEDVAGEAVRHIETLETALRTIQSAVPKYLKKEMTAEEFALVVIGEVDSAKVNKALEEGR
jgi:hypothetical protein